MHLLTDDKSKMGHLDEIRFSEEKIELYVPMEYTRNNRNLGDKNRCSG